MENRMMAAQLFQAIVSQRRLAIRVARGALRCKRAVCALDFSRLVLVPARAERSLD
jgi:hypothetical protein